MEKGSCAFDGAQYIKAAKNAPAFSYNDPLPLFRREIVIDEPVQSAELSVQSPGFGKFYLNGCDVTKDLFISATSDYDKILWYNTYDVSSLLKQGVNVIGAIAGNGFFNESFATAWDFDSAPWRDAPQILLCLRVNGKTVAVSDASWKTSTKHSHIIFSHIRSGEYVDMRKYDLSWMQAGYDDSDWQSVILREKRVTAKLMPVCCQPIREHERFAPVSIRQAEDGAYLVDFGITMSGYAEITLCEERGREILFDYAEELCEDGTPKHNVMDSPHFYPVTPFQRNKLIASGKTDTFKPLLSYYGFRYLRIEGLTKAPTKETISAIFVHQDIQRRSTFESGNDVINFIYRAGLQSTYSNLFWCLTDCPTREKMGWTNDAQASMEQVIINFDIVPLLRKWFEDIKVSMFEDGSLHGTIPAPDWPWGHACGPVCDCILYELPYRVYQYTGKTDMLIEGIPYFERYAKFLAQKIAEGHEFILGDWMGESSMHTQFVADMYLLKAYDITALAHRVAKTGCTEWEAKRQTWRKRLTEKYIDATGKCNIPEQTVVAMLLVMEVGETREVLGEQLVEIMERDSYQLHSGMVGIQYIYHALSSLGRADIACRLLTDTTPGYRSWYEKGETTLWEMWDGGNKGSHNHHMFSGVIAWFYRGLLGITPMEDAPGFERIELRPCIVPALGYVTGSMQTARGRIDAAWREENGVFVYTVTLPDGIEAIYRGKTLKGGKHQFVVSEI
ncbi:MAG: family 78 glycoside hydrolase catalytic domain [Clostridia bacterium]|nr:family 78 glycoside hydrolase catalytic domain [Clostridia bacterium]